MNRLTVRNACAAALIVGLAATTAACSSSSGSTSSSSKAAQKDISIAADASMALGSAQIAMTTSTTVGTQKNSTVAGGVVAFDGSTGNIMLIVGGGSTRIEEHVANGIIYIQVSGTNVPANVKGKWIKVAMTDTATLQKLGVSGLPPVGSILNQLKTIGGTAVNTGKVTVANKVFTKYVVTVSRTELIAKATKLYGATSNSVKALTAAPADTHATIEIYVNSSGLISREVESLSLPVSGKQSKTMTDIALANYGASISIATPPAKDIIDARSLVGSSTK